MNEMKRLGAYLADPIYDDLVRWAEEENRSLSSLVGYLLERAVREQRKEWEKAQDSKGEDYKS